jgi:hypothetical protein
MSTTTTFCISLGIGIALFTLSLLFGHLHLTYNWNANLLKWLLLPTLGYGIAIGLNSFIQSVTCGSVQFKQIAMGSLTVPIAILLFMLLTISSFVRSPVEKALSPEYRAKYGIIFAIGFYMFWAGMFGESFASGFAQSCPK